mgnify:CR=1 FL=1
MSQIQIRNAKEKDSDQIAIVLLDFYNMKNEKTVADIPLHQVNQFTCNNLFQDGSCNLANSGERCKIRKRAAGLDRPPSVTPRRFVMKA